MKITDKDERYLLISILSKKIMDKDEKYLENIHKKKEEFEH